MPYLILNEQGIEYVHTPGVARGRVSRYALSQIESVSINLASRSEEEQGLSIKLASGYLGGPPILLPVFAEVDCVAVYGSMQKRLPFISEKRPPGHPRCGGRNCPMSASCSHSPVTAPGRLN